MPSLSYQEKSLYGEFAADVLVFLAYVIHVVVHRGRFTQIVGLIFLLIVLQIVVQAVIAALSRNRLKDERDRLIRLSGYRAGYFALVSLMLLGIAALWLHVSHGEFNLTAPWVGLHFLAMFYFILLLSEIVKTVAQLVAYRRAH